MPKILVLDDNKVLLTVARATLEIAGHSVVTRESPLGLSAVLCDAELDLALIDVMMPAMDGARLVRIVRSVRSRLRHLPLLVLHSCMEDHALATLAYDCGADGFIVKRHVSTELPAKVARLLADKAPIRLQTAQS